MIEPSLALQTAIRQRLSDDASVLALVAAGSIRDGATRPDRFPSIIVGDGSVQMEGDQYAGHLNVTVRIDLHIWTLEDGLSGAKAIAAAVWTSLMPALTVPGWQLSDGHHVESVRYLRDPSEAHGHAIVSVSAFMSGSWN